MSSVLRRNRKSTDTQIIRLNVVGLSLATIARELNCHPTSITLRLKSLKVSPTDTRRAFMEDIYYALPEPDRERLTNYLEDNLPMTVKDYVRGLIVQDLASRGHNLPPQEIPQENHAVN